MKNKKIILIVIPMLVILSGCSSTEPLTTDPSGFWEFFVFGIAKVMVFFGQLFGHSIGWGLVVTTIVIRIAMLPLYKKQVSSSAEMQAIQPEMKKIQAKYSGNTQEDKIKMNQEIQALYAKHKVNPFAGCLVSLVQMPILFAIYGAIRGLLLNGDPTYTGLLNLGGQKMIEDMTWLGTNLSESSIVWAAIAAILTYAATKITMIGTDQSAAGGGVMKSMLYMMPVMIFWMGITLPAALSVYWAVGNVISVAQNLYMKRNDIFNKDRKAIMNK